MAASLLESKGFYDTPLWGEVEDPETGEMVKVMCMPFTRNANVIGRPQLGSTVTTSLGQDILFLQTAVHEMDDNLIFDIAKQTW